MMKGYALALLASGCVATVAVAQEIPTAAQIAAKLGGGTAPKVQTPPSTDGSVLVDDERAFSLTRPGAAAVAPRIAAVRPMARPTTPGRAPSRALTPAARPAPQPGAGTAGLAFNMQLTFANGSSVLDAMAKRRIDELAGALTNPALGLVASTFRVEGHTNSVGDSVANLTLSQARAQAVMDYLVAKGVASTRLAANGYGQTKPLGRVKPADGANRRVEIVRN